LGVKEKVIWLKKSVHFSSQNLIAYFNALVQVISNRTETNWNCFFVNNFMSFASVALYKKSLNVFFACLCLEMLCHHTKTAFQYSAGSARSGIPQAFVTICWNIRNWLVVSRYELILVTLRYIDVDICPWKRLLCIEQVVRRCCVLSHPFLLIWSS